MIQTGASADSLRRVLHQVFETTPYQWREESGATVVLRRWWNALTDWLNQLAGNHPALFRLLIWTLIALFVAIAVHAVWILIRTTRGSKRKSDEDGAAGSAVVRNAAFYAAEVERLVREGRYAAAMQAEFVRLTLELDARSGVRFHPSKTPFEYVAEVPVGVRAEFGGLVGELYRYAFAGVPCGRDQFTAWRRHASADRYVPQA